MITIDPNSLTPPFEQVRRQLLDQITRGELTPGARLPTVRLLAEQLSIAANTVARAYRELESDSIIETRGRNGSFVSAHGDPVQQQAQLAARAYIERLRQLGVSAEDGIALVTAALRKPS
ncbi:MAG: GntR family transcriptional regulator [Salinibacterium sp.]|nr:GntR family transcriptional regulator [Salinibacterium sp.]